MHIDVRYCEGGELALKIDSTLAYVLAAREWVSGYVNKKRQLCYLILRVPRRLVARLQRMRPTRNAHDITIGKAKAMGWAKRYDQAKLGRVGTSRRMIVNTPRETVEADVPGISRNTMLRTFGAEKIRRQVVA